jgi:putative spermidine/putrescine transport system substrate-binding protein
MSKGGIPYRASTVLLAYNSRVVTTPPKTMDALLVWIKANPGRFTYNQPSGGGSGYAFAQSVIDTYMTDADIKTLVNAS